MSQVSKIALVGPRFFSYIEAIRSSFVERNFRAEFFDERHSNSILSKILYRVGFFEFFPYRKRKHLEGIRNRIISEGFTHVVLIDVEVCDLTFVQELKAKGIFVYIYMWDSSRNKPRFLKYLSELNGTSSFDPLDCEEHGMKYIPLFAEKDFCVSEKALVSVENSVVFSFCGTLHSDRAKYLKQLESFAKGAMFRVEFLVFFHSRFLLFLKSISCPANLWFLFRVSTKGFSKKRVAELFASSTFVLDVPHPGQNGLTARTFEVLRSGSRLITFNKHAAKLPYSLPQRLFICEHMNDLQKVDYQNLLPLPALSQEEDYFLSLDRFVDQLLDLMNLDTRV